MTEEQQCIQELEKRVRELETEKQILKKVRSVGSLDVGRIQKYALIDRLRELELIKWVCRAFGIKHSSYYDYCRSKHQINRQRLELKAHVKRAFNLSRHGFGSRGIRNLLKTGGIDIGRYMIRNLMKESGLISKPGAHKYKKATTEHVDIHNLLNLELTTKALEDARRR